MEQELVELILKLELLVLVRDYQVMVKMILKLLLDPASIPMLQYPGYQIVEIGSLLSHSYLGDHPYTISNVHHDVASGINIVLDSSQHVHSEHG